MSIGSYNLGVVDIPIRSTMTDKKRRQRGSRTHGGGTHKNRRGAGGRGGRGQAGRSKHESHNYEPLGKSGFTRPDAVQSKIKEINIRKIDENIAIYLDEGKAEKVNGHYLVDAREIVEDGFQVDAVKLLAGGQVRNPLIVIADEASDSVIELLQTEGGDAIPPEGADKHIEKLTMNKKDEEKVKVLDEIPEKPDLRVVLTEENTKEQIRKLSEKWGISRERATKIQQEIQTLIEQKEEEHQVKLNEGTK